MDKIKVLFVINSLDGGGAEKSLVSLMNELATYKDRLEIDLLLPNKQGLFVREVPEFVNQIKVSDPLKYMSNSYRELIKEKASSIKWYIKKIEWTLFLIRNRHLKSGMLEQKLWEKWKDSIPRIDKEYDVAVGYLNGYPNYLVCDKVSAKRKILWIHNEYQKIGYAADYDYRYYNNASDIVTISDSCKKNFIEVFPEFEKRMKVLENISSGLVIHEMANEKTNEKIWKDESQCKIISIGRLVEQKNFDLAISTARYLSEEYPEFQFQWNIIGKGPLLDELNNKLKQANLLDRVFFIGAKSNPYPYVQSADIFVQTSLYEGKSIVVDEAKILGKLIIATNYKTVNNSIINNKTGIIVEMTPEALGEAIHNCYFNVNLINKLKKNLEEYKSGNKDEIKKYLELFMK